ncbi:MAG: type II toxin-antitoxin system death-on-curing family toxin [Candidatus Kerfeldbacteria bacterium]
MPREIRPLTIGEVEYVAHRLAKELMTWDEPIPEFRTRFPNALESCLAVPFQRFSGKRLYSSLIDKAAILFYLMIKNHPFQNGNKRIAVTTLMLFLTKNRKWMRVDNQELFNFAKWVASSNPRLKDVTVKAVQRFLQLYLIEPPVIRK